MIATLLLSSIAAFEGFNATILAYGQTGSGKTWTMGSAAGYDIRMTPETVGIIPRVINNIFEIVKEREANEPNSTYKVFVQFLEIYGEDIKDLLDHTKTSKVTIRETAAGEVFVSGAREEVVNSAAQMMKTLEDGTRHRTTASTLMNQSSSRSHGKLRVATRR
jgi:kinesin family protein 4/21/27